MKRKLSKIVERYRVPLFAIFLYGVLILLIHYPSEQLSFSDWRLYVVPFVIVAVAISIALAPPGQPK